MTGVPHAPLVVRVTSIQGPQTQGSQTQEPQTQKAQTGYLQPAAQEQPAGFGPAAAGPSSKLDRPVFQIWVREYLVAETLDTAEAQQIAHQLQTAIAAFRQHRVLDPTQIQTTLARGTLSAVWGDRPLFNVDPVLAQRWRCHPELLAIAWVNNLRMALSVPPLEVTTAQQALHRLQESSQRLEGTASWYGTWFHGRQTATGETFDQTQLTAAHPSLPFNTYLKVTNLKNGRSIVVRVNDRGPFFGDRTLDLSLAAARSIDSETVGVVPIEAVVLQPLRSPEGAIAQKL